MSHQRDPLNDLNELSQLQPDVSVKERALERAQAALNELPTISLGQPAARTNWSRQLQRPRNLVAAAAVAVIVIFAAQWFLARSDSNLAFAQVQEHVANMKSVQYKQVERYLTAVVKKKSLEITMHVMISGVDHKREEVSTQHGDFFYPDLTVRSKPGNRLLPEDLGDQIAEVEGVDQVIPGLIDCIEIPDEGISAAFLMGIAPNSPLFDGLVLVHGRSLQPDDERKVIIGNRLADRLQKKVGDTISIYQMPCEIVGIYDWCNAFENGGLIIPLAEQQRLTARSAFVDTFSVRAVKPISEQQLQALSKRIEALQQGIVATQAFRSFFGTTIVISDESANKSLRLLPETKTYFHSNTLPSRQFAGLDAIYLGAELSPGTDFYDLIRNTPVDSAKQLGERTIDGKKLLGYSIQKEKQNRNDVETWQTTFWVDPATKLPVQIETSYRTNIPTNAEKDSVISDIVFDAPLNLDLFSLVPPSDYHDGTNDYLARNPSTAKNPNSSSPTCRKKWPKSKQCDIRLLKTGGLARTKCRR